MSKIFYFDTETTGLNPKRHDIIQLAYIVEIDGEVKEEGQFKLQPMNYDTIDRGALEVNKITIEQLKTYQQPKLVHGQIVNLLDKYVDKYNKLDKFIPTGYNVQFDMDMFIRAVTKAFGTLPINKTVQEIVAAVKSEDIVKKKEKAK